MTALLLAGLLAATQPPTLFDLAGASRPTVRAADAALVIIDAQEEYRDGKLALRDLAPAVSRIARLRHWAHRHQVPVIFIRHVAPPGAPAFPINGRGSQILSELAPDNNEAVIEKKLPNSFAGTDLDERLTGMGRHSLILTGFMTHMCVEATARAALDRGYTAFVVADATATRDLPSPGGVTLPAEDVQRHALAAIADRFGWVVDSDAVLAATRD